MNEGGARRKLVLAIVGYGRMGRAVEAAAISRGHEIALRVSPRGADTTDVASARLAGIDVAVEFTRPECAADNVATMLDRGAAVVSGTTGWVEGGMDRARSASARTGAAFLWAPNFSLGMQVFYRLVGEAARKMAALDGYSPYLHESHHAGKKDAPSGTGRRLAELILAETPGLSRYGRAPEEGAIDADSLCVSWTRAGHVPGTHIAGWDGPYETIEFTHTVRSRQLFAEGAVRAAEWVVGRSGPWTLEQLMDDVFEGGRVASPGEAD